jgi:hypothetical protein
LEVINTLSLFRTFIPVTPKRREREMLHDFSMPHSLCEFRCVCCYKWNTLSKPTTKLLITWSCGLLYIVPSARFSVVVGECESPLCSARLEGAQYLHVGELCRECFLDIAIAFNCKSETEIALFRNEIIQPFKSVCMETLKKMPTVLIDIILEYLCYASWSSPKNVRRQEDTNDEIDESDD